MGDVLKEYLEDLDKIPRKIITDITQAIDIDKLKERMDEASEEELSRRMIP